MQKIAYLFLEIGCGGSFEFAQNTEGEVLLILELSYSNSKLFLFPLTTMQCLFMNNKSWDNSYILKTVQTIAEMCHWLNPFHTNNLTDEWGFVSMVNVMKKMNLKLWQTIIIMGCGNDEGKKKSPFDEKFKCISLRKTILSFTYSKITAENTTIAFQFHRAHGIEF